MGVEMQPVIQAIVQRNGYTYAIVEHCGRPRLGSRAVGAYGRAFPPDSFYIHDEGDVSEAVLRAIVDHATANQLLGQYAI